MRKQVASTLWPAFVIAGVADVLFFTLFVPLLFLYQEEPVFDSRLAAYTVGFFLFWLMGIGSSALTCYFQRAGHSCASCHTEIRQLQG